MQRFYCTVCKKVKRVQHLPASVENPDAAQPQDRIGECNRHNGNYRSLRSAERTLDGQGFKPLSSVARKVSR